MSQHDYSIGDADGATVRSDLNSALAAIVSQNSGATAPTTTYAYMWWYDTANNILKQRNADDDAWIPVLYFDQTNDVMVPYSTIAGDTITPASDADVTLTTAQAVKGYLPLADGSWTSGHNIIVPEEKRVYFVDNRSGSYNATVKTSGGTGETVNAGKTAVLLCDGTNVFNAVALVSEFPTMPTVGGSPIVESGSNTDGEWVRYADGTQVCWNDAAGSADASTASAGAWYRGDVSWTFPQAFNVAPTVTSVSTSVGRAGGCGTSITTTATTLSHFSGATSATSTDISGVAIGKWA